MRRDFASRHARGVSRPPIYTPEGVRQILAMYFEALPDLRFETERIIARLAGDHVVTGWRMIGTHKPAASLAYHHIRGARSINAPGHHDASSSPVRGMREASPPLSN